MDKTIRRGRPPLPPDKVRANRIVTFLSDPELAMLKKISQQENDTLSAVCRRILTGYINENVIDS